MPTPRRVVASFRLDERVVARMDDFVRRHAGEPLFLKKSSFLEAAITAHLAHLEAQLGGRPPFRNSNHTTRDRAT